MQKLLNKFNGLHYPQEYLCLGPAPEQLLHAYLCHGFKITKDISDLHAFVGYHPLVFAVPTDLAANEDFIEIVFIPRSLQPNDIFSKKDAIARLWLQKIRTPGFECPGTTFFEGTRGEHSFISPVHQFIVGLSNRLYNRKKGNVFLHDNLYNQVQVAYSLPTNISLITVQQGNNFNLFPTDLHGQMDGTNYIISLRFSGKACRQVENAGKLLLTQVEPAFYRTVYALGKNHMQELKPAQHFPFSGQLSQLLQLPVPSSGLSYRELELCDTFNHGIHKLMHFKVLNRQTLATDRHPLSHVHNVYATWLYNKGLPGNYLLR